MSLKLDGESFQEGGSLLRMNRRGGRLDGAEFIIAKAERHGRTVPDGRPPRCRRQRCNSRKVIL
jgi:hypothetical protein